MISREGIKELIKNPLFFIKSRTQGESIFHYFIKKIISIILAIIFLPLSILILFSKYRIANVFVFRIGHLLLETLSLINDDKLKNKILIIPSNKNIANKFFFNFKINRVIFVKSNFLSYLILSIFFFSTISLNIKKYLRDSKNIYSYKIFKKKNLDFLTLDKNQIKLRDELFEKIGINKNDKLVCISNREIGFSAIDDNQFDYRNCSIQNYQKVVKYMNDLGMWVFRIGNSFTNLDYKDPKYIELNKLDYFKKSSEFLVSSKCEFHLGTTSGASIFATIFNRPSLITNNVPLASNHWLEKDLLIFKKYKFKNSDQYLKFIKIIEMQLENNFEGKNFSREGLDLIENNEEELLDLVKEHMGLISFSKEEIKNINIVKKIFFENLKENNRNYKYNANISNHYVLHNTDLFT